MGFRRESKDKYDKSRKVYMYVLPVSDPRVVINLARFITVLYSTA